MAVLVVLLVLLLIKTGISQPNNDENIVNTPLMSSCSLTAPITLSSFINNRNSTLAQLRSQLSSNDVFYARAQSLSDGDSVFGDAQCRNYLSAAQCVACFDAAVSEVVGCTTGNGASVYLDNCFVRYDNYADFYNSPYVVVDIICGNQSASQPSTFSQEVDRLLSDIRVATPKTSNLYVASTRQVSSGNATVYAIAQCLENISQSICQDCLNTAYNYLYKCLPNTEGRFIDMGCFARYSETPFFNENQIIDITIFLKGHSSKVPIIAGALGGVGLFFLILVLWLLYSLWKKSKKTKEGDCISVCI